MFLAPPLFPRAPTLLITQVVFNSGVVVHPHLDEINRHGLCVVGHLHRAEIEYVFGGGV